MIESQVLKGEPSSQLLKSRPELEDLDLVQLAAMTIEFYQKVNFIRLNFAGPDYFGLEGNFSDLQLLLIKMADEMRFLQLDSSEDRVWIAHNFPGKETHRFIESPKTDTERISMIVVGLGDLIQSYQNIALGRTKEESFFKEDSFRKVLKELENSLWIFTMFSKY